MKKLVYLFFVIFLLSSCAGAHWQYQVKRPGVGKVTTQKFAWGYSENCATYDKQSYTSRYAHRKMYFWKGNKTR